MVQLAVPFDAVVAEQDWLPLNVSVTGSPAMGCPVTELVSVPVTVVGLPYVALTALTLNVVGVWTLALEAACADW